MITLRISGTDDLAIIQEALNLVDGIVVEVVDDRPKPPDPRLLKLPGAGTQRQAYLLHFAKVGHATREQAKTALGLDGFSDCHTRVSELISGGFLSETGEKEPTRSGDMAAVVAITDKARKQINLAPKAWFPGGVRVNPQAENNS